MKKVLILCALAVLGLSTIAAAPAVAADLRAPISGHAAADRPSAKAGLVGIAASLFALIFVGTFAANTHMQDGSIRLVEQQVSLLDTTGVATSYILKTGGLNGGVSKVTSKNEFGAYRGKGLALDDVTGQMTLQFINTGDLLPVRLQYFSAMDSTGVAQKLILEDVGDKFGAFEEAMIECKISAVAVPTSVTATLPSVTAT